jgi:hypothetical protein
MADESYEIGNRVRINTGNADGSIPSLPNYQATVKRIIDKTHVFVDADDGDRFSVHVGRLTRLPSISKKAE